MGTEIEILISKEKDFSEVKAEKSCLEVFQIFKDLEKKFSRFLPDSELSQLNQKREMKVSEEFFKVLEFSLQMAKKSEGVFNPLVSLSSLGYAHSFEKSQFEVKTKKINLDFKNIKLDLENLKAHFPENSELDLGGCVKGYAVDKAVEKMKLSFENFIINAGGDLFASGNFHGEKWKVGIANPENPKEDIFLIEIQNQALATSGSYRRKWNIKNQNFHHLVSGKNNKNISKLKSASVMAQTTMLADTLATIIFLLGEKSGDKFLEKYDTFGFYI